MSKIQVEYLYKVLHRSGGEGSRVALLIQAKENIQVMMHFIKHQKCVCYVVAHINVTLNKSLKLVR